MTTEPSFENTTNQHQSDDSQGAWIPFAEPVPDWEQASKTWGVWWYIHVYCIGVLFFILTIFTFVNIIILFTTVKLPQKAYFISLNILVCFFATERGIFMFIDPYNIQGTLHPTIAYLFLSIGLPCMTSAFYLIFIAWMKATKLQRVHTVHKTKTMIAIIVLHFVVSIVFDFVAGYTIHAIYLLICCQVCFILLSSALSGMYFYLYIRIYKSTVKTRRSLVKMSQKSYTQTNVMVDDPIFNTANADIVDTDVKTKDPEMCDHVIKQPFTGDSRCLSYTYEDTEKTDSVFTNVANADTTTSTKKERSLSKSEERKKSKKKTIGIPDAKVPLGAKLILVTAILLLIIAALYLVGIFGCYTLQVLSGQSPEPWLWWAYELSLRLCEIALCWTISIAATRPVTVKLVQQVSVKMRNSKRRLINSLYGNVERKSDMRSNSNSDNVM